MYVLDQLAPTSRMLTALFVMLLSGFLLTRLTRLLRLPDVTGLIISGVLIGPQVIGLIPAELASSMTFVSDIALSFIAFGVGKFFKFRMLKNTGLGVVAITLFEALFAGLLVTVAMYFVFDMELDFSLLLGAIATATAPASTMMTIRQYKIKGGFVNTLLQVVALDDAVCLVVFSIATATVGRSGSLGAMSVIKPIVCNIGALIVGFLLGLLLGKLNGTRMSGDNKLLLIVTLLLGMTAVCSIFDVSPLLSCMALGMAYVNSSHDKKLFRRVDRFTPPIMALFFIVSGMNLDVSSLAAFGLVGVGYFAIRMIGKYAGAFIGCSIAKTDKRTRDWLGVALVPQAGVAIGLAFLGRRMLPQSEGEMLLTIILSSSVLYELIGPACGKLALFRSGSKIGQPDGGKRIAEMPQGEAEAEDMIGLEGSPFEELPDAAEDFSEGNDTGDMNS